RRHTRLQGDWSSDVCSSDLLALPARAKLNLGLRVVRRAGDGFHELQTTFQEIELHDLLLIERSPQTGLTIEGMNVATKGNSVLRSEERRVGKECRARGCRSR